MKKDDLCLPTPNVTDFLTFLCYRRTHTLPANLNFNKLFVVTGEQKQQQPCCKMTKPKLVRSLINVNNNNNNRSDNFNMKVVLQRLFLGDDVCTELKKVDEKVKKPRKRKIVEEKIHKNVTKIKNSKKIDVKSVKNLVKSTKTLKNVQNLKKPKTRESPRLKKCDPVINPSNETPERMNTRFRFFRIPSPLPRTKKVKETKQRKTEKKNQKQTKTLKHQQNLSKNTIKPVTRKDKASIRHIRH